MTEDGLKALTGLRISLAPTQDDVWRRSAFHVDTLHREVAGAVLDAIDEARQSNAPSPIGLVVQGQRGSGREQSGHDQIGQGQSDCIARPAGHGE